MMKLKACYGLQGIVTKALRNSTFKKVGP